MFILQNASISALNTVIATSDISCAEPLKELFLMLGKSALLFGWLYTTIYLLHYVIIKPIYSKIKKNRNIEKNRKLFAKQ